MRKTTGPDGLALVNITPAEMDAIKNAFTLLVRATSNEQASGILNILLAKENASSLEEKEKSSLKRKKGKITQ